MVFATSNEVIHENFIKFALDKKKPNLSAKTISGYTGTFNFVNDAIISLGLKTMPITEIKRAHIKILMEEMAKQKGTPTQPGVDGPYRNRSIEENLSLFEAMKNGDFPEGSHVLRAKIDMTSKNMYCNGCFAAGINYAASLVSLFYGEGDFKETIKIGALCGWDSDNPTATWGGLLGFMHGKDHIEGLFNIKLSDKFNINRTRQNFGKDSIDTFSKMAQKGVFVIDRVVQEVLSGTTNTKEGYWSIPNTPITINIAKNETY